MNLHLEDASEASGKSSQMAVDEHMERDASNAPTWSELARELGQTDGQTITSDQTTDGFEQNVTATETMMAPATPPAASWAGFARRIMGQPDNNPQSSEEPMRSHSTHSAAPAPPRWRFIPEAKSTSGYNTHAAGSYIRGKSADELGAKYTAPDVSLYNQKEQKEDPGRLLLREWKRKPKEEVKEEEFGGLPEAETIEEGTKEPYKEWGETYPVGPKTTRQTEWWDGQIGEFYKPPGDDARDSSGRNVGKLSRGDGAPQDEEFDGNYARGKNSNDNDENEASSKGDDGSLSTSKSNRLFSAFSIEKEHSVTSVNSFMNEISKRRQKLNKREKCLSLLIFLMLILVIALGIVMGKQWTTGAPSEVAESAVVAGIMAAPEGTIAPSSFPSSFPSNVTYVISEELVNDFTETTITSTPTTSPTSKPTQNPTNPSTIAVVGDECSQNDFNLCIAIDMSGSVCNNGGLAGECLQCAEFLCGDLFVTSDVCCYNFWDEVEFAKSIVSSLSSMGRSVVEEDSSPKFSVVQFATDAGLVSGLASAKDTIKSLEKMDYSGGATNHALAIRLCQQTLSSAESEDVKRSPKRKNFIMLITDGEPTIPEDDPEAEAKSAARDAKEDGMFVMPVFISTYFSFDDDAFDFMQQLSSDGKVFDVGDFESLGTLKEGLVEQVSCQS